jgi:PKD repeat protein
VNSSVSSNFSPSVPGRLRGAARWGAAVLVTVALAITGLAAPAAAADDPVPDVSTESATSDPLPTVQINGIVWAQAVVGRWAYAGGRFTSARPAGSPAGSNETPRANLVRYDVETGVMDASWNPGTNGDVLGMAVSPDKSRLYVVGSFTQAAGQARYRIAAFDLATGALVSGWSPGANSRVIDVAASATTVYFTGEFGNINNTPRTRVGAVSAQTGAVTSFNPVLAGGYGGRGVVVSPNGSKVVIAGSFTSTNGSTNPGRGMAALDATSGQLMPWAVNSTIRNGGTNAAIYSLASDGDSVYGSGYDFGGSKVDDDFEGSFRASWSDGSMVWMADCHGDTYSVYPSGGAVYVATHAHYCGNIGEFPQTDPWTVNHSLAFAKEPSDRTITPDPWGYRSFTGRPAGRLLHWYPSWGTGSVSGVGQAGWDITGNDKYVIYGGEFTRVAGRAQQGIVRFAKRGVAPADIGPTLQGGQYTFSASSVVGGQVRVAWPANYDADNRTLTYELFRRNQATPIATRTASSTFWVRPTMTYTDKGLTPGSSHDYRVRVTDGDGNSTVSGWTTVQVGSTAASAYQSAVLDDEPVSYWPLGEGSGATGVDWSGGSNLIVNGAVTRGATGKDVPSSRTATTFGSGAYAAATAPEQGKDDLSVEAWFRTTSTSGGKIVGFGNASTGDSSNYDRHLYLSNNGTVTWGVHPGGVRSISSGSGLNDGQWHHVVGTLGDGGMVLFVDGRRVGTRADTTSGQPFSGVWRVGGDNTGGWPNAGSSNYLSGTISDVAIYDRPLTRDEVDGHWSASGRTATLPTAPADVYGAAVYALDPTLFWRLDETSGTNLADGGPDGSTATVSGAVTIGAASALPGGAGRAATFSGADGAFAAGVRQYSNPTTYSVETWFKTTTTSGGKLIGFGNNRTGTSSNYDRHVYMAPNGQLKFGVWTGSSEILTSPESYNDGQWHHAVATQSAQGMRLYVDGQQVGSNSVSNPQAYDGYWRIGGDSGWEGATYWSGSLDEVAVYGAALTAAQVQAHYALGSGQAPNSPPTASFDANVTGELSVAVDSTSTDSDGTIEARVWNFGDGSPTKNGDQVSHTYATPGTYTVTLTVTDDDGATASTTRQVTVTGPNILPVASFSASPGVLTASFDASASSDPDGSVESYSWTFGDGETGTGAQTSHDYDAAGTYTVTLTVTDDRGASTSTSRSVTVTAPPPATTLASDAFGRTVAAGWGSADVGGPWTVAGGVPATSVSGGRGLMTLSPTWTRESRLDSVTSASASVHVAFSADVAAAGGTTSVNVLGRRVGSNNYAARVRLEPGGVLRLYLLQNQALLSQYVLPYTYTPGEELHVRLNVTGTSPTALAARVWRDGTAEPAAWQVSGSNATAALQTAGSPSLLVSVSSVSTVPTTRVSFDDFEVSEID